MRSKLINSTLRQHSEIDEFQTKSYSDKLKTVQAKLNANDQNYPMPTMMADRAALVAASHYTRLLADLVRDLLPWGSSFQKYQCPVAQIIL